MSTSKDASIEQLMATLKAAMRHGDPQQIQQAMSAYEERADEIHRAAIPSGSHFQDKSTGKTGD